MSYKKIEGKDSDFYTFHEMHGIKELERLPGGAVKTFCMDDTWISPVKSEQLKKFGRTFTIKERKEYEDMFFHADLCDCGGLMKRYSKDLKMTDKRTGETKYYPSEQFLYCSNCNIRMMDCGTSSVYVKAMLNEGIDPTTALNVFD